MGDLINLQPEPEHTYIECAQCGATLFYVRIIDNDDEDEFGLLGVECGRCGAFEPIVPPAIEFEEE